MDPNRRKVVKAVAVGVTAVIGGVVGGFTGGVGEKILSTVFPGDKDIRDAEKEALQVLFGAAEDLPSIFAGAGNLQGKAIGIDRTSDYLTYSANQFTNYILRAMHPVLNVVKSNEGHEFTYDYRKNALFLGGPPANEITSRLLGYRKVEISCDGAAKTLPVADRNNTRTRWAFVYGESDYGIYQGSRLFAGRYSSSTGKEVVRPVFKMLDKRTGELYVPRIEAGFLSSEWLTIIRLKEYVSYSVVIGGMHGYSSEAFSQDITSNIEKIASIAGGKDQYQIVVPVNLEHRSNNLGKKYTTGQICWEDALCEKIFV